MQRNDGARRRASTVLNLEPYSESLRPLWGGILYGEEFQHKPPGSATRGRACDIRRSQPRQESGRPIHHRRRRKGCRSPQAWCLTRGSPRAARHYTDTPAHCGHKTWIFICWDGKHNFGFFAGRSQKIFPQDCPPACSFCAILSPGVFSRVNERTQPAARPRSALEEFSSMPILVKNDVSGHRGVWREVRIRPSRASDHGADAAVYRLR